MLETWYSVKGKLTYPVYTDARKCVPVKVAFKVTLGSSKRTVQDQTFSVRSKA